MPVPKEIIMYSESTGGWQCLRQAGQDPPILSLTPPGFGIPAGGALRPIAGGIYMVTFILVCNALS